MAFAPPTYFLARMMPTLEKTTNAAASKRPRLYWGCCHAMLRLTEVPLFVDHGFEVIPTEVTPSVITEAEGRRYDSEDPVAHVWEASISVPFFALQILRRARLWERDGLVSADEASVFNAFIDYVYIPTRLDVAANILTWFKGKVIFRYFGTLDAGKNMPEIAAALSKDSKERIIILPIFRTLLEQTILDPFEVYPLHNFLDDLTVPGRWAGYARTTSAVIVLGGLHLDGSPQQALVRNLLPLAKRIPIKVLGKNLSSGIPSDIRDGFELVTDLDRESFFREFLQSRMLLYPNTVRYHSHNVPIEAIYAGMPVVFRTETPTFLESDHPPAVLSDPTLIGAARNEEEFQSLAQHVFADDAALTRLVSGQARLTEPYRREHVDTEMRDIKRALSSIIHTDQEPPSVRFPLAEVPPASYFDAHLEVVEDGFSGDLALFHAGPVLNQVVAELPGLQIRLTDAYLQTAFGPRPNAVPVFFAPSCLHSFSLTTTGRNQSTANIVYEVFTEGKIVRREERLLKFTSSDWSQSTADFEVECDQPFQVVLFVRLTDGADAAVGHLSHSIRQRPEHGLMPKLTKALTRLIHFAFEKTKSSLPLQRR